MKACRFCAEEIQDTAIVCKHCKLDQTRPIPSPVAAPPPVVASRAITGAQVLGVVLIALAFFGGWFGPTALGVAGLVAWIGWTRVLPARRPVVRYGGGLLLAVLLMTASASMDPAGPSAAAATAADTASAQAMCQQFVEKRLKAPASAKFPWASKDAATDLGDGKFRVVSYVDAQNAFGAMLRQPYDCSVHWVNGTQWRLDALTLDGR